jgi:4'-phosphopantetheinyl transferase
MPDCAMVTAEIDVWAARLDRSPSELRSLSRLLSRDELERAQRYVFARDRDRFIAARGFLRSVLGSALGIDPTTVALATEPAGKPILDDNPALKLGLHFNLSHSQGVALCAVARGRSVGIDVEAVRPLDELDGLLSRVCTPAERTAVRGLDPDERPRAFLRIWTRKEAYVKMIGHGLGFDVQRIEVKLAADGSRVSVRVDGQESAGRWELHDLPTPRGYVAALAAEGRGWRVMRRSWS